MSTVNNVTGDSTSNSRDSLGEHAGDPNAHHDQQHLLYGPDQSDVNHLPSLTPTHVLGRDDTNANFEAQYRNRFITPYAEGPTYYPQQWVTNQAYIAICNTVTTDYAFPVEVGELTSLYPENPPWTEQSANAQVRAGVEVKFLVTGEARILQVWIPEVTADTHYTLVLINDPNNNPNAVPLRIPLLNGDLTADEWHTVSIGNQLYLAGSEVLIFLESQNFGSTTTVTGGWNFNGQSNNAAPATNGWNHNNSKTLLRIDKTDLDSTDRTSELLGMVPGTSIQFVETASPANSHTYTTTGVATDQGTFIGFPVVVTQLQGDLNSGVVTTMTGDVPVAQATKYVEEADKFLAANPDAEFKSFLQFDDVDQAAPDTTGYGINMNWIQLDQSPNWNLIILGSGGGGGGGTSDPGDLPVGTVQGNTMSWSTSSNSWIVNPTVRFTDSDRTIEINHLDSELTAGLKYWETGGAQHYFKLNGTSVAGARVHFQMWDGTSAYNNPMTVIGDQNEVYIDNKLGIGIEDEDVKLAILSQSNSGTDAIVRLYANNKTQALELSYNRIQNTQGAGTVALGQNDVSKIEIKENYTQHFQYNYLTPHLAVGEVWNFTITPSSTNWYRVCTLPTTNSGQDTEFYFDVTSHHTRMLVKFGKTTGSAQGEGGGYVDLDFQGSYQYGQAHPYDWRFSDGDANEATHLDVRFPAGTTQALNIRIQVVKRYSAATTPSDILFPMTSLGSTFQNWKGISMGSGNNWSYNHAYLRGNYVSRRSHPTLAPSNTTAGNF